MRRASGRITYIVVITLLLLSCMGNNEEDARKKRPSLPTDTLYTGEKAMQIYDYQPVRALQIVDSAVIVGNMSKLQADFHRARIYSWTLMGGQVDSLLHGSPGVRFDSARVISERLLAQDSVRSDLAMQQDALEVLVTVLRQQGDTAQWLRYSKELSQVCHDQGAETEALRTEAEIGMAEYYMGQRGQGMARLDSVIHLFDTMENCHFNELDATIIALKRKINVLKSEGLYLETLPLARRMMARLDDYEHHPEAYHDNTYREPKDSTQRAKYIQFYRNQAQGYITEAYTSLGEYDQLEEAFEKIEVSVREATAREHIARYHELEEKMLRDKAERQSQTMSAIALTSSLGLLLILAFAAYIYFQNRQIRLKNHALIRQINESIDRTEASDSQETVRGTETEDDLASLFTQIDSSIRTGRLYANANIQRQDICERFHIRREILTKLLSDYAHVPSFPAYINGIRLSEVCLLLRNHPDKTVNAIAEEVGLSPRNLRRLFVEQYGITPTDYRQGLEKA